MPMTIEPVMLMTKVCIGKVRAGEPRDPDVHEVPHHAAHAGTDEHDEVAHHRCLLLNPPKRPR